MEGRPTAFVCFASMIQSSIEALDYSECHIWVVARVVERCHSIRFKSGSDRENFKKISNYSLCNSFIFTSINEENVAVNIISFGCQSVTLNDFS